MSACRFTFFVIFLCRISLAEILMETNQEQTTDNLEIGTTDFQIINQLTAHCAVVDLSLATNQTQYTHTVSFDEMKQVMGVLYGSKSISVVSKYLRQLHQLSIMLSIYGHYQWRLIRVSYFISSDSRIFMGSAFVQLWNYENCDDTVSKTDGQLKIYIPRQEYSNVIVLLKGMECHSENCEIRILDYTFDDNHLEIEYQYSITHGLLGDLYPMGVHIGYILIANKSQYYMWTDDQAPHISKSSACKKHSNQIDPEYLNNQSSSKDEGTLSLKSVLSFQNPLNYYQIIYVQEKKYIAIQNSSKQFKNPQIIAKIGQVLSQQECIKLDGNTSLTQLDKLECSL